MRKLVNLAYRKAYKKLQSEDGFALTAMLVVFGVMTVIMTLAVVLLPLTQNETTETTRETAATQGLYVAEAGLNDYVWHLNRLGAAYYYDTTHPAQGDDTSTGEAKWVTYGDNGGSYHLDITEGTETAGFKIVSTGRVTCNGVSTTRTIEANVAEMTFTRFIYLTDSELYNGSPVWFTGDDEIKGRLHTNGTINIDGDPRFWDRVTTCASSINPSINNAQWDDPDSPVLEAGSQDIPSSNSSLAVWAEPAYNDGKNFVYVGETQIKLRSDGKMDVSTVRPDGDEGIDQGETGIGIDLPPSGVIYVSGVTDNYPLGDTDNHGDNKGDRDNADAYVEGTLDGRLTIVAQNNIYLTGDVVYEDQTFSDPNSDMLGLIANNYIWILHYWTYDTGDPPFPEGSSDYNEKYVAPNDITIQAAMLTINHSFGFEWHSYGSPLGTITTKGSMAQNLRGPVGTFYIVSGDKASGYSKDYNYDSRMQYRQPPHYLTPTNSGFEIVSWKEVN